MKLLLKVKKHQHYLYISILSIGIFFIGNALITPKITSVTEDLIKDVVYSNINSKENIISFEFSRLQRPVFEAQKIMNASDTISLTNLKAKLTFNKEQATTNKILTNSFIKLLKKGENSSSLSSKKKQTKLFYKNFKDVKRKSVVFDSIIKNGTTVINRKIVAKRIDNSTIVLAVFDIDLLAFWKYFSDNYKGAGSYLIVTNAKGICLLHPETKFIGNHLKTIFKKITIKNILNHSNDLKQQKKIDKNNLLKEKVDSEYLGLQVLRYFKEVRTAKNSFILAVSFPVDIYLNESITDVRKYFSWISLLALITFTVVLILSRLQLRNEYVERFKIIKEKDLLAISNETYQRENTTLQLNQLKKKMNPHFLFNSLNSLHALISIDKNLSQQFVLKLADVYRYLLENRQSNLITIKEELSFLKQYVFLQKIRFNSALQLEINQNTTVQKLSKKIPFLALETLVENAIKHNEFTKKAPLCIHININDNTVVVENTYRPRRKETKNSHNIGLDYLNNSYQYYNVHTFKTEIIDQKFICFLPLLSENEISLQ
jgi:sensor histidine kinase YesM